MQELLTFIDFNLQAGLGRMFKEKQQKSKTKSPKVGKEIGHGPVLTKREKQIQRKREKRYQKLLEIQSEWRLNALTGDVCRRSCYLFDALIYKFGKSNRRQKFWRQARQVYTELRRVNARPMHKCFEKFTQFEKSRFAYKPSKQSVCYLGSLLLERIIRLDRVRTRCALTADLSMGYVELKHMLTFNLMCIAIMSDVWEEALKQIGILTHSYDSLSTWVRSFDKRFPKSVRELPLQSVIGDHHSEGNQRKESCQAKGKKSPKVEAILHVIEFTDEEESDSD